MGEILSLAMQLSIGAVGVNAYLNHSCDDFDVPIFLVITGMTNCALIIAFLYWGELVFWVAVPFNFVIATWGAALVYTARWQSSDRSADNFCHLVPSTAAYAVVTAFWVVVALCALLPVLVATLYCFLFLTFADGDVRGCQTRRATIPWCVSVRYSIVEASTYGVEVASRVLRRRRRAYARQMAALCDLLPTPPESAEETPAPGKHARDQLHRGLVSHLVSKEGTEEEMHPLRATTRTRSRRKKKKAAPVPARGRGSKRPAAVSPSPISLGSALSPSPSPSSSTSSSANLNGRVRRDRFRPPPRRSRSRRGRRRARFRTRRRRRPLRKLRRGGRGAARRGITTGAGGGSKSSSASNSRREI